MLITIISRAIAGTQLREMLAPEVQVAMHSSIISPIQPRLVFSDKEKADAWITDMMGRLKKWIPDPMLRERYLTIIQYEASRAGLDPQLVLSIITVESKFNKYAISPQGARGMMQVMPFWIQQIGNGNQNLFDVQTNIRFGCTILRHYLKKENGNMKRALARYNGSLGKEWYATLVYNSYTNYWKPYPMLSVRQGKVSYIKYN